MLPGLQLLEESMNPTVKLSERSADIKRLTLEGKSKRAISVATNLTASAVAYHQRLLRKMDQLPWIRKQRQPVDKGHKITVDGVPTVPIEEIRVVTCPKCGARFAVQ